MSKFLTLCAAILVVCSTTGLAATVINPDAENLTKQGIDAYDTGDYQAAIKLLSQRARMAPQDAKVYYYLGNSYLQLKENAKAARMYSACIRIDAKSQAGQYALNALERLSATTDEETKPELPDPEQVKAEKQSLMTQVPLDKQFNDAVVKIKSHRSTLQIRVDRVWNDVREDLQSVNRRNTSCYICELQKVKRKAENDVVRLQTKELRLENRLLAPYKIDARAVPQLPQEKPSGVKTALGSLMEYLQPEKPFDPFAKDLTPEVTSKFMTINDVFGELRTYQPSQRRIAKQVFKQLKRNIENKQDILDQALYQERNKLIDELISVMSRYGDTGQMYKLLKPSNYFSSGSIPRADEEDMSPMTRDVTRAVNESIKRIQKLEDSYYRDVDSMIAGAKGKVGSMIAQTGEMNKQLKHASGTIQLVPQGTDMYTRNYINFGDRGDSLFRNMNPPPVKQLRATPDKLPNSNTKSGTGSSRSQK